MAASSDAIAFATLFLLTAALPSQRQSTWSAVRNVTWTLSADTRCPVMTQDVCQLSGAVRVGSGRAIPACFTGRRVIALPGAPSPTPWKSSGMNAVLISSSTGPKASPIPGVTRCKNAHSCWSDYFSTAYAYCGCLRATPANVRTDSAHPSTFSLIHLASASLSPTNPPSYLLPVTTFIPIPLKYSLARVHSSRPQPRCSWLALGSTPEPAPSVVGHVSDPQSSQTSPRPCIISIPWLSDVGVSSPVIPDDGGDPYTIFYHVKGVPLGHALLAVK